MASILEMLQRSAATSREQLEAERRRRELAAAEQAMLAADPELADVASRVAVPETSPEQQQKILERFQQQTPVRVPPIDRAVRDFAIDGTLPGNEAPGEIGLTNNMGMALAAMPGRGAAQFSRGLERLQEPGQRIEAATDLLAGASSVAALPALALGGGASLAAGGARGLAQFAGRTGVGMAAGEVANQATQAGLDAAGAPEDVQQLAGMLADIGLGITGFENGLFKARNMAPLDPRRGNSRKGSVGDDLSSLSAFDTVLPKVSETVDGRIVRSEIPNQSSIEASIDNPEILPGVREVSMDLFTLDETGLATDKRTRQLASDIAESGELNPLIVAFDDQGPYILEGGHRYEALKILGAKSFPAQIVLEEGAALPRTETVLSRFRPDRGDPRRGALGEGRRQPPVDTDKIPADKVDDIRGLGHAIYERNEFGEPGTPQRQFAELAYEAAVKIAPNQPVPKAETIRQAAAIPDDVVASWEPGVRLDAPGEVRLYTELQKAGNELVDTYSKFNDANLTPEESLQAELLFDATQAKYDKLTAVSNVSRSETGRTLGAMRHIIDNAVLKDPENPNVPAMTKLAQKNQKGSKSTDPLPPGRQKRILATASEMKASARKAREATEAATARAEGKNLLPGEREFRQRIEKLTQDSATRVTEATAARIKALQKRLERLENEAVTGTERVGYNLEEGVKLTPEERALVGEDPAVKMLQDAVDSLQVQRRAEKILEKAEPTARGPQTKLGRGLLDLFGDSPEARFDKARSGEQKRLEAAIRRKLEGRQQGAADATLPEPPKLTDAQQKALADDPELNVLRQTLQELNARYEDTPVRTVAEAEAAARQRAYNALQADARRQMARALETPEQRLERLKQQSKKSLEADIRRRLANEQRGAIEEPLKGLSSEEQAALDADPELRELAQVRDELASRSRMGKDEPTYAQQVERARQRALKDTERRRKIIEADIEDIKAGRPRRSEQKDPLREAIRDEVNNDPDVRKARRELNEWKRSMRRALSEQQMGLVDSVVATYTGNLFTGIATHVANIVGNTVNVATLRPMLQNARALTESIGELVGGSPRTTPFFGRKQMAESLRGAMEGIADAYLTVTDMAPAAARSKIPGRERAIDIVSKAEGGDSPLFSRYDDFGEMRTAFGPVADVVINAPFRFLSAGDRPFYHAALRGSLAQQAEATARLVAKNDGLSPAARRNLRDELIKNPPLSFVHTATEDALVAIFANDGDWAHAGRIIMDKAGPIGRLAIRVGVTPVVTTPSNISARLADIFIPEVASNSATSQVARQQGLNVLQTARQRAQVKGAIDGLLAKYDVDKTGKLQKIIADRSTGIGLTLLGYLMAAEGWTRYADDRNKRDANDTARRLPASFQIGDTSVDLARLFPASAPLIAGAAMYEEDRNLTSKIISGGVAAGGSVLDMPFMSGPQNLEQTYTNFERARSNDDPEAMEKTFQDFTGRIGRSVVPSWLTMFGRLQDPIKRDTTGDDFRRGIINLAPTMERIPGLREQLPPTVDLQGEAITFGPVEILTSARIAKDSPIARELGRIAPAVRHVSRDENTTDRDYAAKKEVNQLAFDAVLDHIDYPELSIDGNDDLVKKEFTEALATEVRSITKKVLPSVFELRPNEILDGDVWAGLSESQREAYVKRLQENVITALDTYSPRSKETPVQRALRKARETAAKRRGK